MSLFFVNTASAESLSNWSPGRIIDDFIFTNATSMNTQDIQNFLNSKLSSCDTYGLKISDYGAGDANRDGLSNTPTDIGLVDVNKNGTVERWEWGKYYYGQTVFTCLNNFSENSKSAAQIIYEKSQAYSINPQVLIVLLQKEQGLVTDSWPLNVQYRAATGYGCPDTAPCDKQYYGLTNQLDWSAKMFRAIMNADPNWYAPYTTGINRIYYNPGPYNNGLGAYYGRFGTSPDIQYCGSTEVNIQNRATAALYNYTPYQPNAAALRADYGSGDLCSTYGNRNFYLYFTSWFGPTEGYLFRTNEDGRVYIRGNGNSYYYITSAEQLYSLGYGANLKSMYFTPKSYISTLTYMGDLSNSVRFGGGDNVYLINNGKKYIYSYENYVNFGSPPVSDLDTNLFGIFNENGQVSSVVRQFNTEELYKVENGRLRYIGGPNVYKYTGLSSYSILALGKFNKGLLPEGAPILMPGTITRTVDTEKYGVVNQDMTSQTIFTKDAALSMSLQTFNSTSTILDQLIRTSPAIGWLVKDGQSNLYLIDGLSKYNLSDSQLRSLGKVADDFILSDDSFLKTLTTRVAYSKDLLVRFGTNKTVFIVNSGVLKKIESLDDFNRLGLNFSDVLHLSSSTVSLFNNNGESVLPQGTLYRINNQPEVYILGNDQKSHLIPSGYIFDQLGFTYQDVRNISVNTSRQYEAGAPLLFFIEAPDGSNWAIISGTRLWLSPIIADSYLPSKTFVSLPTAVLNKMRIGKNITQFIRIGDSPTVYYIDGGQKKQIGSPTVFNSLGGKSWDEVTSVSSIFAGLLSTGTPIQ